jgi:hypothetical protein
VVAILGVLAAVVIPNVGRFIGRAIGGCRHDGGQSAEHPAQPSRCGDG